MNAIFKAQSNYCTPVWMLHSRNELNNKINRLHKRCSPVFPLTPNEEGGGGGGKGDYNPSTFLK